MRRKKKKKRKQDDTEKTRGGWLAGWLAGKGFELGVILSWHKRGGENERI